MSSRLPPGEPRWTAEKGDGVSPSVTLRGVGGMFLGGSEPGEKNPRGYPPLMQGYTTCCLITPSDEALTT